MAFTVAGKNLASINTCENSGDWSALNADDVTDFYKYGSQCVGFELWSSGNNDTSVSVTLDLSTYSTVRCWLMTTVLNELNTDANGGIQIYLSDGTNTGYYYVSGSTSYPGGWWNLVADLSGSPDSGSQPTLSSITTFGFRFNLTASAKKVQSLWIDRITRCDGLVITGNDSSTYADFDDIYSADAATTLGLGCIRKIGGKFFMTGCLDFNTHASEDTLFKALSQDVVFEDRPVASTLYGITVTDTGSTYKTDFQLGAKVGTAGVQGCKISVEDSSQTAKFFIDAKTDTDVDNFHLYGCTFYGASTSELAKTATGVEVLNCIWEKSGQVDPNTGAISGCSFIDTTDADAALLWNNSIDIDTCSFIGNTTGAGIEMPSASGSPYAYDALTFSGNTYDVYNSSGSAISINKNNGSDPTTSEGSSVTFLGTSVTTQITVKDVETFAVIQNARVLLEAADASGPFVFEESISIVSSGGTATVTHTGHGLSTNDIVHIRGCNQPEYNIVAQITVTGVDNYTYSISGTPASPATGTPVCTEVLFNNLTNSSGIVTDTREFSSDQNMTGRARKTTSSPLYKSTPIVETIDKDNGLTLTVYLIPDE